MILTQDQNESMCITYQGIVGFIEIDGQIHAIGAKDFKETVTYLYKKGSEEK